MTDDQFWDHIRATRTDDPDDHADRLTDRLATLPVKDILAFGRRWIDLQSRAFTRDLWGAAYLINGDAADEDFPSFIDWLILHGQSVYEAAVKHPDSLADVADGETECEVEDSPAYEAYCMVTEQDDYTDQLIAHYPDVETAAKPPESADRWPFTPTELRKRLPRLATMYLGAA